MNRLVLVVIAVLGFTLVACAEESVGEVRIQTIAFGADSNWSANQTGATEHSKFTVRIDKRSAITITTNRAGVFANLSLTNDHLVNIKLDGKPLTSFRFSFEGRSNHLLLWYNEFYGTWSLSEEKRGIQKASLAGEDGKSK
jgi:hypothetical protein